MSWLVDLFFLGSVPGSILILALCSTLGLLVGSLRVRGIDLGIVGVLFAGLLLGHLGAVVSPELLEFARDFGLILFVYAIGVQVGPGFMSSLRQRGAGLNAIAVFTVLLGSLLAVAISRFAQIDVPVAVGMLAGATTNTPSLGAAQTALRDLPFYTEAMGQMSGLGYAVAYPFGILEVILAMVVLRALFRVGGPRPAQECPASANPGGRFVETLSEGDGLRWMAWATLITAVPVLLAGIAAKVAARADYATTCGLLAGSMTDPPALAFATASARSGETTMAYATVYPLTMVLRILSTQVIVLVMMN